MKKLTLITIITAAIFSGCVKQKNCEEGISGTFIYLEEPYKTNGKFIKDNVKIMAHFIEENKFCTIYHITNSIPHKFQTNDSIRVRISLNKIRTQHNNKDIAKTPIYSLKCIEKED